MIVSIVDEPNAFFSMISTVDGIQMDPIITLKNSSSPIFITFDSITELALIEQKAL